MRYVGLDVQDQGPHSAFFHLGQEGGFLICPMAFHEMIEIADGLHQCPECGVGPILYWALSNVDATDKVVDALCITFRADLLCYTMSYTNWEVGKDGGRLVGSLSQTLLGYISSKEEKQKAALPFISETPRKLVLKPGMFPSPLGEKVYGQKHEPGGRSATRPSRARSTGRSPGRPRKK